MTAVLLIEYYLNYGLLIVMALVGIFAFVDSLLRPARGFVAAEKMTKPAWMLILGIALVIALLSLRSVGSPFGLLGLIGIIASGVYLADVRPAVAQVSGR